MELHKLNKSLDYLKGAVTVGILVVLAIVFAVAVELLQFSITVSDPGF